MGVIPTSNESLSACTEGLLLFITNNFRYDDDINTVFCGKTHNLFFYTSISNIFVYNCERDST